MKLEDILKAFDDFAANIPGYGFNLGDNIQATSQWLFNHSKNLIKGDCCGGVLNRFIKPIEEDQINIERIKQMLRDYSSEMINKVDDLTTSLATANNNNNACQLEVTRLKDALSNQGEIERKNQDLQRENEELKNREQNKDERIAELTSDLDIRDKQLNICKEALEKQPDECVDLEHCKEELNKCFTEFQVDQRITEEVNKVWDHAIANSRLQNKKIAKLQSDLVGCKSDKDKLEKDKDTLILCLNNYKTDHKLLFDVFKDLSKGLREFIFNFYYELFQNVALFINPGLYNNQWYANQYRQKFLEERGLLSGIIKIHTYIYDHYKSLMFIMNNFGEYGEFTFLNSFEELINKADPNRRALYPFLTNFDSRNSWIKRLNKTQSVTNIDKYINNPFYWRHKLEISPDKQTQNSTLYTRNYRERSQIKPLSTLERCLSSVSMESQCQRELNYLRKSNEDLRNLLNEERKLRIAAEDKKQTIN